MRCKACDVRLTARESTRKGEATGEYLDLCDLCFSTIADMIGMEDSPYNVNQPEEEDEDFRLP